jgi:hypothetical protein
MNASPIEWVAAGLFAVAVLHTFSTGLFERLAHAQPRHAGIWHLLGEVEVVFGFWAMVLVVCMFFMLGSTEATAYLEGRNFTEPMFVFAIMVIAASKPILSFSSWLVQALARGLPLPTPLALYALLLSLVPLLGSFITEPAAMTLAALMLRDRFFAHISTRLKYATLGVLFVNVSIGGTLTPFAAPPVLMVAGVWGWDMAFMLQHFGWKAAMAVAVNTLGVTVLFRQELLRLRAEPARGEWNVPWSLLVVHLGFLASVVVFAHHPPVFMGLFMFFLGVVSAYPRHQNPLILREAFLVAFFLAGLVVLGGLQRWWLQPALMAMSADQVFLGATALTAITDNAALTYLGSLVPGLSEEFKVALVSGAVVGGGLTVIANAPNPAGVSILRGSFPQETVQPLGLLAGAALPTGVALIAMGWL